MGWLDHSTNNIILDAVLTDYGRQKLASGNGGFAIKFFSLGDDEIDYKIVKKYGRTVGKEKIEKNTPIFEALTNQNIALKYPLVSVQNQGVSISVSNLPYLTSSPTTIELNRTNKIFSNVTINQLFLSNTTTIDQSNLQKTYSVTISDRFFTIAGSSNCTVVRNEASQRASLADPSRMVTYTLTPTIQGNQNNFSFNVRQNETALTDSSTLSIYGTLNSSNQRVITSYLKLQGETYGTSLDIPIVYTKDA